MNKIIEVDKKSIKVGDVILCTDNRERTVCSKDIKYSTFMGVSIFGNSYPIVKKVLIGGAVKC